MNYRMSLYYLLLLAVVVSVMSPLLLEPAGESQMIFADNSKPGLDRLFVPIKLSEAPKILEHPVYEGVLLKVSTNGDRLIIKGTSLRKVLERISMRSDRVWSELKELDDRLFLSADQQELTLGIYEDEESGVKYVNVPAGFLTAYIR